MVHERRGAHAAAVARDPRGGGSLARRIAALVQREAGEEKVGWTEHKVSNCGLIVVLVRLSQVAILVHKYARRVSARAAGHEEPKGRADSGARSQRAGELRPA